MVLEPRYEGTFSDETLDRSVDYSNRSRKFPYFEHGFAVVVLVIVLTESIER